MSNKKKAKAVKTKAQSRKKVDLFERNLKVAKNRGQKWRQSLMNSKMKSNDKVSALRSTRVMRGMSQNELVKRSKFSNSVQTFGRVESGLRAVKSEEAQRIASELKVPMNKVFKKSTSNMFVAK